jgi:lactoylglutathione lyase
MIKNLYAVCLLVNDFEKSLAFYRDILGLSVNSTDSKYADFKVGETLLAIFEKSEAAMMFDSKHMGAPGGAIYAYAVEDVDVACKTLMEKGVKIFEGPKQVPWGQTVAYFKDPDGHIWEITK